jgi:iron complex outermembrane receptor protein
MLTWLGFGMVIRFMTLIMTPAIFAVGRAQPPASAANNPINFDICTYDICGRYFYMRAAARF